MKSMELFFELMTYDYLVLIAQENNLKINGFMNIKKAPKNLLRNVVKNTFNNEISFKELLEDVFGEESNKYKELNLEEFINEFYLSSGKVNYTVFEVYSIFIDLFPDDAERLCDKININIESGKHIFSGLLVNNEDITEENCISIIEKYLQIEDEMDFLINDIKLVEDMLLELGRYEEFNNIRNSIENKTILDICKELGDLSEKYDETLLWLAFINNNIDSIKKDDSNKNFFNRLLFNILQMICKDYLANRKDKILILEEKVKSKLKEILDLNYKIDRLSEEILNNEETLNFHNNIIKDLEEKIMQNASLNFSERSPNIIIITKYAPDRVMDSIGNYIIIHPEDIEYSYDLISNFKGIVYIDRGSIESTKGLLSLEDYLERLKIRKITVFSRNIEELVQNIIISKFTLEG